jgi:hypothetical protein
MALDLFFEFTVLALLVEQAAEPQNPSSKSSHANSYSGFRIPSETVLSPREPTFLFLLEGHTYFIEASLSYYFIGF